MLDEYKFIDGPCLIETYVLDNDNDPLTLYAPINDLSGLPASSPCG